MAQLPENWKLKTKPRPDGKLDIVGKDDTGQEYKVRTTAAPEVTPADVSAIAETDRERTTAREYVSNLVAQGDKVKAEIQSREDGAWEDAAMEVVYSARSRRGPGIQLSETTGASGAFRRGWEAAERGLLWWQIEDEIKEVQNVEIG